MSSNKELLQVLPLWMLIAFQKKRPGEVYAGTARHRPARRRLPLAQKRRRESDRFNTMLRSIYAERQAD